MRSDTERESDGDELDNDAENFAVDSILEHKGEGKRRMYLIKWEGDHEPSWEPESNITPDLVAAYTAAHPSAVAPIAKQRNPSAPPAMSLQAAAPQRKQRAEETAPLGTGVVAEAGMTQLRAHAVVDSALNGVTVQHNESVDILAEEGEFYHVRVGRKKGYIKRVYVCMA